jgi:Ca2+-binding RTX toxin-like protein
VASYTDAQGTDESVTSAATDLVANVNDAPVGAVTITGTATEDQTLTASNDLADEDGLGTISYQWQRDGVDIDGATGETYTLGQADVGAEITVVASYTDAQGTDESVTSAATDLVANVNDLPTGTVTISGTATEDQTLTASNDLADEDGLGTISYQWQRDGVDIDGATGETYTLGQADVGAEITVVASYTDAQGTDESVTSAATDLVANVNDAPDVVVPLDAVVTEFAPQGTVVTTIAATDDDEDTLIYTMVDDANGRFAFADPASGDIIVNDSLALDFEQQGTHDVTFTVSDGIETVQRTVSISVQDNGAAEIISTDDVARRLVGGVFADQFTGGLGDDELIGAGGNDTLQGGAGNDTLNGGDDQDRLEGGDGNDLLLGGNSGDTLIGGLGDDTLDGGLGIDTAVYSGIFTPVTINLESGFASGGAGNDVLIGIENVFGSASDDTIIGTNLHGNRLEGSLGNDTISGLGGSDTLLGGEGNDLLLGGDDDDVLDGGAGNDTLRGEAGNDTLIGGAGEDRLEGGNGNDLLLGGTFSDTLIGGLGDDTLDGGSNFDTVVYSGIFTPVTINLENGFASGGAGNDVLIGIEHVFGSASSDTIYGTNLHGNRLEGSLGNDTIFGLDGRDTILGGDGNDSLLGGSDVDRLFGGAGNDTLDGGLATDFLTGGAGADTFVWNSIDETGVGRFNRDEIRDFNASEGDVIDLSRIDADATTAGDQAFNFVGSSLDGSAGSMALRHLVISGVNVTIADLDVDGDGRSDGQIYIIGDAFVSDFIL